MVHRRLWSLLPLFPTAAALLTESSDTFGAEPLLEASEQGPALRPRLRAADDGPLSRWLYTLKVPIDDIEQKIGIATFKATDLVCTHTAIDRAISQVQSPPTGQARITVDATGLYVDCTGKWSALLLGGDISVVVKPGAAVHAQLATPINETGVPYSANVVQCSPTLDLDVKLSGSIVSWLLNAALKLLQSTIRSQIKDKLCTGLKTFASQNLTDAISWLNEEIMPEEDSGVAAEARMLSMASTPLASVASGSASLDWTKVDLIKTIDWVLEDVLTAKDINKLFQWALNNTGTVKLPGPEGPLAEAKFEFGESSTLTFSVGMKNVTITGVDGINNYQPVTAVSPSDLYAQLALGTPEVESMTAKGYFVVNITSSDDDQPGNFSQAVEPLQISVGLTDPAAAGRVKLLLNEDELHKKRSPAQWLYGAEGCLQDSLMESPRFEFLNVSISGVASPLKFASETTGRLEGDLMAFANNMVQWFNAYYLKYLPTFIMRTSTSVAFINKVNALLADAIKPTPAGATRCISAQEADAKVDENFPQYADWNGVLGGPVREAIDMIADNYFATQNTSHIPAVSKLQPLDIKTNEVELTMSPKTLDLTGMSAVKKLRVLLPEANDTSLLRNIINVDCKDYRPTISGTFETAAKARNVLWHSGSEYRAPCGDFEVDVEAQLDLHRALKQPFPPASPLCILAPFQRLALAAADGSLEGLTDFVVKLQDDCAAENPITDLCKDYPKLCERLRTLAPKGESLKKLNQALSALLLAAHASCGKGPALAAPSPFLGASSDAEGDTVNPVAITLVAIVVSAIISSAFMYAVATASMRIHAGGSPESASLAVQRWMSGKRRDQAQVLVVTTALATALVLRTVSLFCVNVANATAHLDLDGMGKVLDLHLITFTFPSMVSHYWDANAHLSALLLVFMSGIIAYGVILLTLVAWLAPMTVLKTRACLRIAMWLARFPFVDLVFFGHLIPILNRTSEFPLGLSVTIRNQAMSGIAVGVASATLCILAANGLHGLLPVVEKARSPRSYGISMTLAAFSFIGSLLFLVASYFRVEFTELTGDIMPTSEFSGASLIGATLSSSAYMGLILVVMLILAPLMQVTAAVLPDAKMPQVRRVLQKAGDAVFLCDVFLGGFNAVVTDVDGIAKWIVNDRYHEQCSLAGGLFGEGCIGLNATPMAVGFVGLILAVVGSVGLLLLHVVEDLRDSVRTPLQLPQDGCRDLEGPSPGAFSLGERQPASAAAAAAARE